MQHPQQPCLRACAVRLLLLLPLAYMAAAAHAPDTIPTDAFQGIPVCPPGFVACGLHGCYATLLHRCNPSAGCSPVGMLAQLSNFVKHGFGGSGSGGGAEEHQGGACPIPFVNACGGMYCNTNEVCSGAKCVAAGGAGRLEVSTSPTGNTLASAQAACLAARESVNACASDHSPLAAIDCNLIGVGGVRGVHCFQSDLFNCAVAPGAAAQYACRGMAGVAQAMSGVVNTTLSTAAALSAAAHNALAMEQQQMVDQGQQQQQEQQQAVGLAVAEGGAGAAAWEGDSSSDGISEGSTWRQELESIGQAVKQHSQPLLQPLFQNLAERVSDASKSVLNFTMPGVFEMGQGPGSSAKLRVPTVLPTASVLDLGPVPVKDAAADLRHGLATFVVAFVLAGSMHLL